MPPQPPPQQADEDPPIVLSKFVGLINVVDRERLDANELVTAINIDLDDRDQSHRRRGYTKKITGRCHSVFRASSGTYGVIDSNLCLINPDYSVVVLKAGMNVYHLCYVELADVVYFSSLADSGKIVNGQVLPWGAQNDSGIWISPVVIPTPTLAPIAGRLLAKPPMATVMTYYNGRIYMGCGKMLWHTELYLYDYVDKTKNYAQYESDITMLGTVGDGIYCGTEDGLWFLQGPKSPMARLRIMDSGVIFGSMVDIPAELANPPQVPADADTPMKISISFLTENGFCVGQDSGSATNFTEDKFIFPAAARAAAMYRRQDGMNQYVVVLDSDGGPADTARFSNYLDPDFARAVDGANPALDGMEVFEKWEMKSGKLVPEHVSVGEEYIATLVPAM